MAKKQKAEPSLEIVAVLKSGIEQPFWRVMKKLIQQNVDYMTAQIVGDTKEELSDAERSKLIDKRQLNKELLSMPETLMGDLEAGKTNVPQNYDPYE